ncbi:Inositol-1,4,5-trisphosphate 5-phosphatase 1 [Yamadazyma tenuis]|uniref:phosphoinositide 5-phosphatase n=1 Tax=Candida tenuis (strain ATCC 10573 / BCRC 21748 / CBS 615 / JCM 9827 / NBRC 10315 / NRRL Y-1498 / VKM Y-70) TaxID=590646 RepID=G3BAP8_CANTC|nr:inositol-1,4,5-triphosphate 5-phosphatase [Yamadazyma tenuis ATCC 10573]EGV62076.1 inositol-1,4,5-triphosphate 5-phosphatase [Yamadazyma tenuis ATCC 10573]WEJ93326.1 Inositol-1,4,5-trisphosphate 5-phosphatase 1 [Yamadazyma tenuis]
MKVLYKESPRTIVLYSETCSLSFHQVQFKRAHESVVAMEFMDNSQLKGNGFRPLIKREVSGCLGFINVDNQVFIAVITGAIPEVAHPVDYESVDKIYSVDFISLTKDTWDFATLDSNGMPISNNANGMADTDGRYQVEDDYSGSYAPEPHPCTELKKLLSNGSFYYSNDFDLTSLLQNRGINRDSLSKTRPHRSADFKMNLSHYSEEYMWNKFMMEGLIKYRSTLDPNIQAILDENKFLTTVIRGFAKTVKLNSRGDSITIISKQSWKRAGTRFNARGIDDDGNVANFVETEFIYNHLSRSSISSFIQIRGSVPAFWEQDSTLINPKITITRSAEATQPIFNAHFENVCSKYGVCHIVNLLSKSKPPEIAISNRYKQLYTQSDRRDELSYTEFDFHHETKQSGGFGGASKILPMLNNSLEQFGWFSYDAEQGETITRQDGVFRINCLDCLDRTNLIEQVICQNVLEHIMNNESSGSSRERYENSDILSKYNSLWADNGDAISQIYTGTNALKSSFSRSGKMNFAGALSDVTKSVSRMYQNTFVDSKKQSTMDLLLGYDSKNSMPVMIYDPVNDYVQEKLKLKEQTFTSYKNIMIFTGTLNVNATLPNPRFDLTSWLFPTENAGLPIPDIYAIGIQELIELNAGSILNADTSRPTKWAQLIEEQLNSQNEQYLLLRTESIASMTILLFVKKSQVQNVTHVSGSSKKTGLGGMTANKGACAVRFDFGATSFSFITSHLAAGVNAIYERHNDYSTIMSGLTFVRNMNIIDHDHIIWFGDLNFRINLTNEHVRERVAQGQYDELLDNDQLINEMNSSSGAFKGFTEAPITFNPTYKFDKGTSNYDTSEKQRVPSWTDRILTRSHRDAPPLSQLNYNSLMNIEISDHKPVYATFKSSVKFIDEAKKLNLTKQIYEAYKSEHPGSSDDSLSEPNGSDTSYNPNFMSDTLSELNLLDDFDSPPPTPRRPPTVNSSVSRRVPPPPSSRRTTESDRTGSINTSALPRRLPPIPTDIQLTDVSGSAGSSKVAPSPVPTPPPARKTAIPIGFSSTPLVPSRSNSATPKVSPIATPTATDQVTNATSGTTFPVKPSKPSSLSGTKIHTVADNENKATSPPPPPPRDVKSLSDWKPLVPQ